MKRGVFCRLRPGNGWIEPRADLGEATPVLSNLTARCYKPTPYGPKTRAGQHLRRSLHPIRFDHLAGSCPLVRRGQVGLARES